MASTSRAGVSVMEAGRETTVRCPVKTVRGSTARSTVSVSTDDVSVLPDSLASTASTVCLIQTLYQLVLRLISRISHPLYSDTSVVTTHGRRFVEIQLGVSSYGSRLSVSC